MHALEIEFAPQVFGQFAAPRRRVAGLPLVFCKRRVDLAVVVRFVDAGARREVGQLAQMDIELHRAAFDGDLLDARAPRGIGGFTEQLQRLARIGIGDDGARRDAFAAFQAHAFSGNDLRDGNAGDDGGSGLARRIAEIERHHAHAAAHIAPHAGHAAQPA